MSPTDSLLWELKDGQRALLDRVELLHALPDADVAAAVLKLAEDEGGLAALEAGLERLAGHPVALDTAIEAVLSGGSSHASPSERLDWLIARHPGLRAEIERSAQLGALFALEIQEEHPTPTELGPELPSGERRFRVIERAGSGSCGVVYKAVDRQMVLGQATGVVALKIIDLQGLPQGRHHVLLREGAKARGIDHPNVIRVFDQFYEPVSGHVVVMEFAEGGTLADNHAMFASAKGSVEIVAQMCDALHALHDRGILHGDVKPGNILITSDGHGRPTPKLADFGVACVIDDPQDREALRSTSSCRVGNALALAPECLAGAAFSIQSDIYALGILLLWMRVGHERTAPNAADAQSWLHALRRQDAVLAAIVERAIAHAPHDRWGSAAELGTRLREWRDGVVVRGVRTPLPGYLARWMRQHAAPLIIAGVVLLVGVAGVVTATGVRERAAFDRGREQAADLMADFIGRAQTTRDQTGMRDALTLSLALQRAGASWLFQDLPDQVHDRAGEVSGLASELAWRDENGIGGLETEVIRVALVVEWLESKQPTTEVAATLDVAENRFRAWLAPDDPWLAHLGLLHAVDIAKQEALHRTRGVGSIPDREAMESAYETLTEALQEPSGGFTRPVTAEQSRDPLFRLAVRALWHLSHKAVPDEAGVEPWCQTVMNDLARGVR